MTTYFEINNIRVPGWDVSLTVKRIDTRPGRILTIRVRGPGLELYSRNFEIDDNADRASIEETLWSNAESICQCVPAEVRRQVMRVTVQAEEEMGL